LSMWTSPLITFTPDSKRVYIATENNDSVAVVDVRVEPGYTAAMTAAMTRKSE